MVAEVEPVIIETLGGLGNQLFQYAFGRELAYSWGCDLLIDPWHHNIPGARPFELDHSAVNATILRSLTAGEARPAVIGKGLALTRLLWRKIYTQPGDTRKKHFGFDPDLLAARNLHRLTGYFQSWRYFPNVADQLRRELMDPLATAPWVTASDTDLREVNPWVAIHVRRGDYGTPGGLARHGTLGLDYYEAAWEHVVEVIPGAVPVLFSDEPGPALQLLRSVVPDIIVIQPPDGALSIDIMRLMSRADSVVTANSTFSWWGAWLGQKKGRLVVAPRRWFAEPTLDSTDVIPPEWRSI